MPIEIFFKYANCILKRQVWEIEILLLALVDALCMVIEVYYHTSERNCSGK